jgi:hypothetical protein
MVTECDRKSDEIKNSYEREKQNILQIHAPQTGCTSELKGEYEELIQGNVSGEYICIMEHFNGKKNRNGYKTIMGPQREGNKNSERENLLDVCICLTNSTVPEPEGS